MSFRLFLLSFAILLNLLPAAYAAENRIDITPRRVILAPRDRSGEFTLLNLSRDPGTFRVELLNYRQDDKGVYTILDQPLNPAFDPETVIRLSPRQFTLLPDGRQKVRFSLRKPADLPDGEYRFHIRATRMAEMGPPEPVEKGSSRVGLTMNIGTAIPVIVRHGKIESGATLSDLKYIPAGDQGKPELHFVINRTGNASTIGSAKAVWMTGSGQGQEIGVLTNLNVFTENDKRYVSMPLNATPAGGTIHLLYTNDETQTPYAEAELPL